MLYNTKSSGWENYFCILSESEYTMYMYMHGIFNPVVYTQRLQSWKRVLDRLVVETQSHVTIDIEQPLYVCVFHV